MKDIGYLPIVVAVLSVIFVTGLGITALISPHPDPYAPQKKCEAAGGLFFNGGIAADNCVFPPKEQS